jgi:hypothetical protein
VIATADSFTRSQFAFTARLHLACERNVGGSANPAAPRAFAAVRE